jgi:hypothetical protein
MTCSIFIKSCEKDFGFLSYCLKSIHKFASGFAEIVVVIPDNTDLPLTQERVVKVPEPSSGPPTMHGIGYVYQQVVKMNADKYCQSDFILHIDSDTVFNQPVTPQTFFIDGNPMWLITPMMDVIAGDKNAHAHATAIRQFSGVDPEFDFMRRMGQVIPRWAYGCFRDYTQELHGMTFEKWAFAQPFRGVTEFNFMGHMLYQRYRNFIHFHDTRFGLPESVVTQVWSWNGLTPEIREQFEQILA